MSTSGDLDPVCLTFTRDARDPDLCALCQKVKDEHPEEQGQGARPSRRRQSEPATNSVVTGVRISALASKFQEPQTSAPPDYGGPAPAVASKLRKSAKGPAPLRQKLGSVGDVPSERSSPSSTPSSLSSATSSSSSSSSSSRAQQQQYNNSHGPSAISPKPDKPGQSTPATPSPKPSKSVINSSACDGPNAKANKGPDNVKAARPVTAVRQSSLGGKSQSQSSSSQPPAPATSPTTTTTTTAATTTSTGRKIPKIPLDSSLSRGSQSSQRQKEKVSSLSEDKPKPSVTKPPSKDKPLALKKPQDSGILKRREGKAKTKQSNKPSRHVSIPDVAPSVIGDDGGLDHLAPCADDLAPSEALGESQELYLSLTDEEKQLALVALANTLWNSDIKNLQVDNEISKRICREFEDLQVESLWLGDRFQALADCDAVKGQIKGHTKDFGTFPQISKAKSNSLTHQKLGELFQNSIEEGDNSLKTKPGSRGVKGSASTMKTVRLADSEQDQSSAGTSRGRESIHTKAVPGIPGVERLKGSVNSGTCSLTSLSSEGEGKEKYGSSCGSADSGVEMGGGDSNSKERTSMPYKMGDITDCLYETLPGEDDHEDDLESFRPQLDLSLTESTMEGFQAIALLNDVLKDYTDLNESSTDDVPDSKDAKNSSNVHDKLLLKSQDSGVSQDPGDAKRESKAKKSSDFEARMASVAAHLDLSKQQTRSKKQAPRPPVSPPPEPTGSTTATTATTNQQTLQNVLSPKKGANQPEPVFKMVPVGRSIVTVPQQNDVPSGSPSQAPAGLEEFALSTDSLDCSGKNGDVKGKKGISSFFKNILRRGKDTQDSFDIANPEVQLNAKPDKQEPTVATGSVPSSFDEEGETTEGFGSRKGSQSGAKFSPQAKFMVMPPMLSPPPKRSAESTSSGSEPSELAPEDQSSTTAPRSPASSESGPQSPVPSGGSPSTQRKLRGGLASPKMILKKASAKFSPPVSRHKTAIADKDKETDVSATSTKPYPAPKPAVPPPAKPAPPPSSSSSASSPKLPLSSASSSSSNKPLPSPSPSSKAAPQAITASSPAPASNKEQSVRRRAKSPKRGMPPVPPLPAMPPAPPVARANSTGTGTKDRGAADFTKELERRLSKTGSSDANFATLPRAEGRRSMPVPPPSPPREMRRSGGTSPGVSPPSSPTSPCGDFTPEWSGGSTSTLDDEQLRMAKSNERIELPTSTNPGRKGFLGKLGQARKSRAPQPPAAAKTLKSVESATLPRGDKKAKKINPADISGPVMVTDLTNSKVLQSRRNTISLGDESPLPPAGPENKEGANKEEWDEFLCPVLSPLGSLENLYEAILPKPNDEGFHYYDPPAGKKPLCPNIPADGYLEPITPLSLADPSASQTLVSSVSSAVSSTSSTAVVTTGSSAPSSMSSSVDSSSGSRVSVRRSKSLSAAHTKITPQEEIGQSTFSVSSGGSQEEEVIEISEERRLLLASQPIYEEIPAAMEMETQEEEEERREDEEARKAEREKRRNNMGLMSQSMHGGLTTSPSHKAATLSSSMLPPPPPPPDGMSNWNSLPRPRPAPRRRPKRPESSEQYVSMNKPNAQVALNDAKLRETLNQLTNTVFTALQECHTQWEQRLNFAPKPDQPMGGLHWKDLDLQAPPLHTSSRCILYQAEYREKVCQVLVSHRRPVTGTCHPSLLQPVVVFEDQIPVGQLCPQFVQTSPHIHSTASVPCHVAVGSFQIAESLNSYLSQLEESSMSPQAYLRVILTTVVQLLSAWAHCLDQGLSQYTDLESLFVVARPDLQGGPVVAFLACGPPTGGQQEGTMTSVLEALAGQADLYLQSQVPAGSKGQSLDTGTGEKTGDQGSKGLGSNPREALAKLRSLISNKPGQEGRVRAAAEFLLWGPEPPTPHAGGHSLAPPPLSPSPLTPPPLSPSVLTGSEEDLYSWLERERTTTLARLAVDGLSSNPSLDQLYKLKFLLKSSAGSLSESLRRLMA